MSELTLTEDVSTRAVVAGPPTPAASASPVRGRRRTRHSTWIVHVVLGTGAVVMVFPFIWQTLTAFKTFPDSVQVPPVIIPDPWVFTNFVEVFDSMPFAQMFLNSVMLTINQELQRPG